MSVTSLESSQLAIAGGPQVRTTPWPGRGLLGAEEKAAVDRLFDEAIAAHTEIGYNGPEEDALCKEFAEFMGGGYADAVNSGTTAVYVALKALNPEPFTEVIVGPITDAGGMMPVVMMNCIPVVPDTMPGQYNTGPEQIEKLISPLTSAIVVAHIGGEPADIEGIVAVAKKHNIPVVEDCAQAHAATLNGKMVGTFGDIAAFSTMFGKHFCTGGQGGIVYTRNQDLYTMVKRIGDRGKPFGLADDATNYLASLNFNMNDLSAAIGRVQLKKLPSIVQRRRELAGELKEALKQVESVKIAPQIPGVNSAYWFVRIEVDDKKLTCSKDEFCTALKAEGIPMVESYRHMPHTFDWYKFRRVFGTSGLPWSSPLYKGDPDREFPCPNAEAATGSQFIILLHESWGSEEIADTIAAIKKVEAVYLK